MQGGIEAIYDDIFVDIGLLRFAGRIPAKGGMFGARRRLLAAGGAGLRGTEPEAVVAESAL
jgi:hypothetical protein